MKKLLMTATALFAVGGVTAAVADITISGKVRYHYQTWSDDNVDTGVAESGNNNNKSDATTEIWIKGTHTSDTGLTYGAYTRIRQADKDKFYLDVADDWGKFTLGNQHSPAYAMSLGADWRGTITGGPPAGATRDSGLATVTNVSTSGKDAKVIYHSPMIGGFQAGLSLTDAGDSSKGNSTEYVAQYTLPDLAGSTVKLSYIGATQKRADDKPESVENKNSEIGIEINRGKFMISAAASTMKATPGGSMSTGTPAKLYSYVGRDNGTTIKRLPNEANAAYDSRAGGDNVKVAGAAAKAGEKLGVTEQKLSEVEIAYKATDSLLVNLVHFRSKMNKSVKHNDDKYNSTMVGAKYTVAPGFYVSLSHTSFKYTDKAIDASQTDVNKKGNNKGSAVKLRVNVDF